MSCITLISTNRITFPYAVYPLGMAVIASALEKAGHDVDQIDLLGSGNTTGHIKSRISQYRPDFIGISLRNIDDADSLAADDQGNITDVRQLIGIIRKTTSAPIILGGSAFSLLPETILDYLEADFGIVGEGEKAIVSLIEQINRGNAVERIIYPADHPIPGHRQSPPCFTRELVRYYLAETGMINLQTKRGCPFRCAYCSYPALEGRRLRVRPDEAVIEDIKRLGKDCQADALFFTDSVFNDTGENYLSLAENMIRNHVNIKWVGYFRPSGLGTDEIRLLKRSGLAAMEIGSDAATDETLQGLDKGFSFHDVLKTHRLCVAEQIPMAHFFIFGGPMETMETVKTGLENINRLEKAAVFACSGIRILPKTPLHRTALNEGVVTDEDPLLAPKYYFSNQVGKNRMNDMIRQSFQKRPGHFFPPSQAVDRVTLLRRFGLKGLLWDRLARFDQTHMP